MSPDTNLNPIESAELQKAQEYIADPKNIISLVAGSMCVDGRYGTEQTPGMTGRTGTDLGDASTLLSLSEEHNLGLTPEQCLNLAIEVAVTLHEKFYMHTGKHGNASKLDCGHEFFQTIPENSAKYIITSDNAQLLMNLGLQKAQTDKRIVNIDLEHHDHEESGLIINHGVNRTFRHSNNGQQFFIYDAEKDLEYMKLFVAKLNEIGMQKGILKTPVNEEEFIQRHNEQRDATVEILVTGKGKPVFETNADVDIPKILR